LVGQTLSHYRIESKLGEGGMGVVYRARDENLERDIALKVLPPDRLADETARARFRKEALALSQLNHPHICTIYEVGEADGRAYIAMEYVAGRPLSGLVPHDGLPIETVIRYGAQIADALAHAQDHSLVHRDLKSSNVMITPEGRAKVLDFGLAKRVREAEAGDVTRSRGTLTEAGSVAGTLHYMAPEVLQGEPADARSDLWALGVMLYEMATGVLPFQGQTGFAVSSAILKEPPAPLPPGVPAALRAIILRCLAKEPGQRYQRAGEVRAALEAVHSSGPVELALPRRRRRALATALWLGAALAVASGGLFLVWRRAYERPPAAARRVNPEALQYYQRAKFHLGREDSQEIDAAIDLLEKAVGIDPNFAAAQADLARSYGLKAFYLAPKDKQWEEKGFVAAEKALALDPNSAEAFYARGIILWRPFNGFPHELAIREFQRALQLNPNLDDAHHQLGLVYLHVGLLEKGLQEEQKAVTLNPNHNLARFRIGVAFLYQGKAEQALAAFNSVPREISGPQWGLQTAWSLYNLGRKQEAADRIAESFRDYPQDQGGVLSGMKAVLLADAGDRRGAEAVIQKATEKRGSAIFITPPTPSLAPMRC
jgi:tetratricopeptide (TPR) repeat protein/tRNA A-37 threonylcarbamoyl transferase component Bud32